MIFMFGIDFHTKANQHRLIEALLFNEKETVKVEENININEEDISF
mgnify:FL=1